ncbi:acyl-CoA dehydrogenase family protein [Salicibibacter kimchii]|uniref:Medium-chain specific acyl-CoA dehydrogenase, mitochondrial n=1 Tax=Salicibibacter kimchii TaxID=2099786 RepID=A0A345BWL3_9BACI|nr:acyl-CoA dehydrogenase family protein [Salicibibacter kimchii]AXF55344.1 acyl-CoA dehydrogenase [Salicibibacter kimchii]
MINFSEPEEIKEVLASLDRFIEVEIKPLEKKFAKELEDERYLYDENGYFTKEIQEALKDVRMKSANAGFYTMFGMPELGGNGDQFGPVAVALIYESLTKKYGENLFVDEIFPVGLFTGGLTPVLLGLQDELKEKMLPELASGESLLCFGLSEPEAGSDVWSMKTKAVKDGDHWVINGTKQWITNSPYADYAMIFAITDLELVANRKGGISTFLVPFDGETCVNSSVIPYLGSIGSRIGTISLDNARVHESYIIGELHDGFGAALHGVDIGRVVMAAQCVGTAQWALDIALDYAKQRKTFGVTIENHQAVQMQFAECAMDIYAGRNMLLHCAWKMENQEKLPLKEISMIKAFTTEMGFRVVDRCMQICGGMGLTNEMELEKAWRHMRATRVPDGTAEIQRRTIARRLLKGDQSFN